MNWIITYQDKMGRQFRAVVAMLPDRIREKCQELKEAGFTVLGGEVR